MGIVQAKVRRMLREPPTGRQGERWAARKLYGKRGESATALAFLDSREAYFEREQRQSG
jgi:hypothetical protein